MLIRANGLERTEIREKIPGIDIKTVISKETRKNSPLSKEHLSKKVMFP